MPTEAACRLITVSQAIRCVLFIYMFAVAGGLEAVNSDIDLLATICQPLTEAQRATLMQELLEQSHRRQRRQKTRHCRALFGSWFPSVFSNLPENAIWRVAKRVTFIRGFANQRNRTGTLCY